MAATEEPRPTRSARKQEPRDNRLRLLEREIARHHYQSDALIEVLHTAQELFGFLDKEQIVYIARQLKLPLSQVYGVVTFYHHFSTQPKGEHTAIVCLGTACYVKGAYELARTLEEAFDIKLGDTTPDGKLTAASARCLGACGLAPVVVWDGTVLGKVDPESLIARVKGEA